MANGMWHRTHAETISRKDAWEGKKIFVEIRADKKVPNGFSRALAIGSPAVLDHNKQGKEPSNKQWPY